MPRALERASEEQVVILPVLLRDAAWRETPLAKFQLFPADLRPIARRRDRDKVLTELVDGVRSRIESMPVRGMSQAVEEANQTPDEVRRVPTKPRAAAAVVESEVHTEPVKPVKARFAPATASQPTAANPQLSPSVERARADLGGEVSAVSIVTRLLQLHPEYGGGAGGSLTLDEAPPGAPRDTASAWLLRVRTLFRADTAPVLHGRLVVRGLALLEPRLTKQLLDHGFLPALEDELSPPLVDVLSPEGRRRWEPDEVPAQADRPARTDRLRRTGFAAGLAAMIEEERRASEERTGTPESFLVHLHGPWGSGKTSLLRFLAEALRRSPSRWVVVHFNAW
jgi:hypothetical protein